MAIAHDVDSQSAPFGSTNTVSWTHTCTGANGFLEVSIVVNNGDGAGHPTGVTYNGVSMTAGNSITASGLLISLYQYYLFGPATGANTVTVTFNNGIGGNYALAAASSYTGVNQSGLDSAGGTAQTAGSVSTVSVNVTTVHANAWILDTCFSYAYSYGVLGPNSPQVYTYLTNNYIASGGIQPHGFGLSYQGPIVTPGSTSDGWADAGAITNAGAISMAAFSIYPAGGATTTLRLLPLTGVGM